MRFSVKKSKALCVVGGSFGVVSMLAASAVSCKSRPFVKSSQKSTTAPAQPPTADRAPLTTFPNWKTAFEQREADYVGYLTRTDEKGKTEVDWYHSMPLGLQGLPRLVLKTLIDMYPEVWTSPDAQEQNGVASALGASFSPEDYVTSSKRPAHLDWSKELKPIEQRKGLPFGMVSFEDKTGDPGAIPGTQNTFFSCAACHTSRVLTKKDGKPAVRFYFGGPGSEIEAQKFAGLLYETVAKMTNIETEKDYAKIKPKIWELAKFVVRLGLYDCKKYMPEKGATGEKECTEEKERILGLGFLKKLKINKKSGDSQDSYAESTVQKWEEMAEAQKEVFNLADGYPEQPGCGVPAADAKKPPLLKLVRLMVGSGVKVKVMMHEYGKRLPYRPAFADSGKTSSIFADLLKQQQEKTPPEVYANRSGQMDAFGLVQGVLVLNAMRPDYLLFQSMGSNYMNTLEKKYGNSKIAEYDRALAEKWGGDVRKLEGTAANPGVACKNGEWNKNAPNWYTNAAALSDIKSLYRSEDETLANWDGNQGASARVLASGFSSVGDPLKVFTEIHETQNAFVDKLPAPPYPFEEALRADFFESAKKGEKLFNESTSCVSCHTPKNATVYDTGTDLNRALVVWAPETRLALIALTSAACEAGKNRVKNKMQWIESSLDSNGDYWCEKISPTKPTSATTAQEYMSDVYRPIRGVQNMNERPGYKADPIYGVWGDAPYFHNGSVPTLRELLMTKAQRDDMLAERGNPGKFIRGNIAYDQKLGGFVATKSDPTLYVPGDTIHNTEFDTSLRGNSNGGHEFFHRDYQEVNGMWIGKPGTEFSEQEKEDVVNYLKLK